jgi:hypothetical protein
MKRREWCGEMWTRSILLNEHSIWVAIKIVLVVFGVFVNFPLVGGDKNGTVKAQNGEFGSESTECVKRVESLVREVFTKEGVKEEIAKSNLQEIRRLRDEGCVAAIYGLMHFYMAGVGGVEKDYEEAVSLTREAAERGYAGAQFQLGLFYRKGVARVPHDVTEAIKWYRRSARQGNRPAMKELVEIFRVGEGSVNKNEKEVRKWEKKLEKNSSSR